MLLQEIMDWRYAVRAFAHKKLDQDTLELLLDATRKSASSYGLQPYRILVIESSALRERLLPHSYGQEKVVQSSHLVVLAAQTDIGDHTVDAYIENFLKIRQVPYEDVAGYADHMKTALAAKSPNERQQWAQQQADIALGTLLTAASILKVDSCPMTGFDQEAYDRVLGLKERGLSATAIVALGYRSDADESADLPKVRVDYEEMIVDL